MIACRWFEAFVLVSGVATLTLAHQEVSPSIDLSQVEAEIILKAQTSLRRYLISCLAQVEEKIIHLDEFRSVVGEIIQGLQRRDLDPFKSFTHGNHSLGQSSASFTTETIWNLQGANRGPGIAEWSSLLQTLAFVKQPNIQLNPVHLQKIRQIDGPIVDFVLTEIQKSNLKPSAGLLGDVLYNFRFRNYSPELAVIAENINETLAGSSQSFLEFHSDDASKQPFEILSDLLRFISQKSNAGLVYQIGHLLSALSDTTLHVKSESMIEGLFDLILSDDYPPDVIQAKNALSSAVRGNQIRLDLSEVIESAKGHSPMEKLLLLIARLSSMPSGSPFYGKVHAIFPHVKLRYLASKGKFFRPRTAADVRFLIDSFLTFPDKLIPAVIKEIEKIFQLSDWKNVLINFDYSRYSKPRPLVVDMLQALLNGSPTLPVCSVIVGRYFLRKNIEATGCTSSKVSGDVFSEELTTLAAHFWTGIQEGNHPTVVAVTKESSDDSISSPFVTTPQATPIEGTISPPLQPLDTQEQNSITDTKSGSSSAPFVLISQSPFIDTTPFSGSTEYDPQLSLNLVDTASAATVTETFLPSSSSNLPSLSFVTDAPLDFFEPSTPVIRTTAQPSNAVSLSEFAVTSLPRLTPSSSVQTPSQQSNVDIDVHYESSTPIPNLNAEEVSLPL